MAQEIIVDATPTTRIDRWLKRQFEHLSQGQLEKWLRSKDITVNGMKVTSSHRVQEGDRIELSDFTHNCLTTPTQTPKEIHAHFPTHNKEEAISFQSYILYDDEEIIVINKPSGLSTQGGTGTVQHVDKMMASYAHYFEKKEVKLRLVHRLDRDTSGVLVIAKTLHVANHLAEQFHDKTMEKKYWAIVCGKPDPMHGVVKAPLVKKNRPSGDGEAVFVDQKQGKKAVTNYHAIKPFGNFCWVELKPLTGRTHQLRVHMLHIGTPILGDLKYSCPKEYANHPLHLHARSLTLTTIDGNVMTFVASPPSHFETTLQRHKVDWENYT